MRWRAGRKQNPGNAVGNVVLGHRLSIGEHRDTHGHQIKKGEGSIIPTRDNPPGVSRPQYRELVGTGAEKSYGSTHAERGSMHPQIVIVGTRAEHCQMNIGVSR